MTGTCWTLMARHHYQRVGTGSGLLRLETRDDEPTGGPSGVDQLYRRETGLRTQVGEVTFRSARPDAHELRSVPDGSTGGDEGSEDVHLTLGRGSRECAAQVPVSHAIRADAGRDSLGVRLIIRKRRDC